MNDNPKNGKNNSRNPPDDTGKSDGLPADKTLFRDANVRTREINRNGANYEKNDATRIQRPQPSQTPRSSQTHNKPARPHIPTQAQPGREKDQTRIRPTSNDTRIRKGTEKSAESTRIPGAYAKLDQTRKVSNSNSSMHKVLKDRFTLEKVIGVGGMGVVYKATDRLKVEARDREPYVAIKVLSEEFRAHPESFIALQRESRKTQRIAHPNVVKVYDFDRDGDTVFMTMEYLEGVPLDQLIKQYSATGLPREEAWSILKGLCSALIYAHAEHIVHSDFKPGNIFITDSGIPKIFDFGIARAVANVDRLSGKTKDKTVFDAGSLGALTPAYASMEMLQGQQPDVRDDIYALGCIAYEMLTGEHPFNRMPADEAFKGKLKPRKISSIKKRQWKAIEKALMFKREDRLASVEEFYTLLQPKARSVSLVLPTILVIGAIAAATYFIVIHQPAQTGSSNIQVSKIEFNIRYSLFKNKIIKLLKKPTFTSDWQDTMWDQVSGLLALLKNKPDSWLKSARKKVYDLYIQKYTAVLNQEDYALAKDLLTNAYRYTDDPAYLDAQRLKLAGIIRKLSDQQRALLEQRQQHQEFLAKAHKRAAADDYLFNLALKNVNQQLECESNLNMREFGVAIDKLRSIDHLRYSNLENGFVTTLVSCITQVAKVQPARAAEDKRYALRIFDQNPMIQAIKITPLDACNRSIAGLGARGERDVCRDKIKGGGFGPAMVVIPGNGTIDTFAIGKYEITVQNIDDFCEMSGLCSKLKETDLSLPAVNISVNLAENYVRWLSRVTKHKYRLPTKEEWLYAARATGGYQDPNRNCALNSRGIEKGGQLVRANTGGQNAWGLVNYIGNAREWVYDKSHNLFAIGGSFEDPMNQCTVNTIVRQSGNPDDMTGFRVVRQVER